MGQPGVTAGLASVSLGSDKALSGELASEAVTKPWETQGSPQCLSLARLRCRAGTGHAAEV